MKFRSDRARIAVVGAAFRMPGVGGEGFWEALVAGKDLITHVEPARWAQESFLHPRKNEPGTSYTFAAGSIGDVSGFDAAFFGISPREAEQMDPQQRLLLEMSWEAFENAAIRPSSLRGQRCGVYVGLSSVDYAYRRADDLGSIDATTMTGNTGSIAANRISYVFDLRGPSMAVDTACSSSLVALHQACQSIRHGESDSALVGGISLHLHPYGFVGFSKASMLSRQGRCKVFDDSADGYVRSEGGAVVLLKPLTQAITDGNQILAVIAATGVNNDGRKSGLTVPSHSAQATLLREVYARAEIEPTEIDYFEAHGTGTAVGDPIEARAIGEALGQRRPRHQPLPIGSVKSQVGHLEAASGMAGLLKALQVLRHRRVPPNIHLDTPNRHIDFADWNLAPVTAPLALRAAGRVVVGVSAFGFGGTNAHAVLTTFDAAVARPSQHSTARVPLMLSARSPGALREGARRMAGFLRQRPDLSDYDIAHSAMFTRDIHTYRLSADAADRASLTQALERFADAGADTAVVTGSYRRDASAPAFIFSGNGSQWVGMGLRLLEEEPVFSETLAEIDQLLAAHTERSIVADLRAAPVTGGLERTEVAQPALFAIQVGLTRLLERQGVRPVAVCGHSVGEVAAAWASGALTLEAAVRVIYQRSVHQATTRGSGCMAAVELGEPELLALLGTLQLRDDIVVAAINSANSVTVAGSDSAVGRLGTALARRRIVFKRLALDYAFHSPAMDPIRDQLARSLADLSPDSSTLRLYSTVSGALVDGSELGADHWWRNVREPVRFEAAIRAMVGAGINTFVEIGPRPVLVSYLNELGKAAGASFFAVPSLTASDCGGQRIRSVVQQLELSGALPDPTRLFPLPGQYVELPQYAWQRERFWHPSTPDSLGLLAQHSVHPLLGHALAGDGLHWENHFDTSRLPSYADHAVAGSVVFPAAGFVEMALAAAAARRPGSCLAIEDLEILAPLLLDAEHSKIVRLRIHADDARFTIVSRDRGRDDGWRTHAVGRLVDDFVPAQSAPLAFPSGPPDVTAAAHYALAAEHGLQYGPAFQAVTSVWISGGALVGALRLPACFIEPSPTALLHPAYLDGAFQLLLDLAQHGQVAPGPPTSGKPTFLPVRIDRLQLTQPHTPVAAAQVLPGLSRHRSPRGLHADFTLYDASGSAVASASGVRFRATNLLRGTENAASWITTRAVPMPRREPGEAAALPSTAAAAHLCAQRLHEPQRVASRMRFAREMEPLLDVLCASFAERALRRMVEGATLDPEQLLASGRICAEAESLLRGLLEMLTEDGVLQAVDGHWQWSAPTGESTHFPAPPDIWNSLIGDYPQYAAVIARTGAAGSRLAERLRAGVAAEPRERRSGESSFSWVDACTQPEAAALFAALNDVIKSAVAAQPAGARLRVLYVMGSTSREEIGSASSPPAVDRDRCDIVIAARTGEALDELRARLSLSHLSSHLIDLDHTGPQGTAALGGRFDLIVLSEGLSDAPDAALRLANIRALLFGGGLLLALEQHASRSEDLSYGLNAGWWRADALGEGAAVQSRRRAPQAWRPELRRAGFTALQEVCDAPGASSGPYLLLAQADRPAELGAAIEPMGTSPRVWLLVQDEVGYSAQLATALGSQLAKRGQTVIRVTSSGEYAATGVNEYSLDPAASPHWVRLLAELHSAATQPDAWVHLAGLDLSSAAAPPAVRVAGQLARAAVLTAWLQACSLSAVHPDGWVVAAEAGLALLPPRLRTGRGAAQDGQVDPLRDAVLWGLTRVAIHEFAESRLRWIDLSHPLPCQSNALSLAQEMLHPDAEDEILLTPEGRFVPRMASEHVFPDGRDPAGASTMLTRPAVKLDFLAPGPFRNLTWGHPPENAVDSLQDGEVEIDVRAAGLNFRDVMYAMGLLPDEAVEDGFCGPTLGMELAGVVLRTGRGVELAAGDEVIAIAPASFANRARTRAFAVTRKPTGWSFAAAATVPTAFFTAYYALVELAHLQPGERVLIHGAAGGVGIAAIQIAKYLGAEILATAGTAEKRDFVQLLGADRVFDSRSLGFAEEVMQATAGAGVDVVLNSLAGEAMRRNLRLLRPFGRMIELGKRDFYENSRLGLRPFRNNIAYFGIDADQLIAHRPETARRVLQELMKLFADGVLRPLPHRSFSAADIEVAFRHMQASRHIGKIVVTFPPDFDPQPVRKPEVAPLALQPHATYLVTGGLSGFGLRTAWWLVSRGARHLALLSRTGSSTPSAQEALRQFAAAGVSVMPMACDVADGAALRTALTRLEASMPPLRGVVHAAMVIEDGLIRDMNHGQLQRVLAPKVAGALNLHELTRACTLDFFLLYSSATTLFGNPGQGAYVAANMAVEALAGERRALGLPATCISWGPIADAGYLARHEKVRDALVGRLGGRALQAEEALRALDALLAAPASQLGYLELDWNVLRRHLPAAHAPKFCELLRHDATSPSGHETSQDARRRLAALPDSELLPALTTLVRSEIAQVLRIAPERIEAGASLLEIGMDSLMAVELATSIEARLGIQLSVLLLTDAPTTERIAARIAQQLRPNSADPASSEVDLSDQVRLVAAQHAHDMSQADLTALSTDLKDGAAPLDLAAGQNS